MIITYELASTCIPFVFSYTDSVVFLVIISRNSARLTTMDIMPNWQQWMVRISGIRDIYVCWKLHLDRYKCARRRIKYKINICCHNGWKRTGQHFDKLCWIFGLHSSYWFNLPGTAWLPPDLINQLILWLIILWPDESTYCSWSLPYLISWVVLCLITPWYHELKYCHQPLPNLMSWHI